jgi:hypothetical protein
MTVTFKLERERESILAALGEGRAAVRSEITLDQLADEWQATRRGHTRIYAGDWREAEERNEIVLRQLADAGIGQ